MNQPDHLINQKSELVIGKIKYIFFISIDLFFILLAIFRDTRNLFQEKILFKYFWKYTQVFRFTRISRLDISFDASFSRIAVVHVTRGTASRQRTSRNHRRRPEESRYALSGERYDCHSYFAALAPSGTRRSCTRPVSRMPRILFPDARARWRRRLAYIS